MTENVFDTGRDLRESPRFHDVAKSVGAKTGVDPEMGNVDLVGNALTGKSFNRKCFDRTRVLTEKYHEAMLECKKACTAYEDLEAQTEDLTLVPYDERDHSKSSSQSVD